MIESESVDVDEWLIGRGSIELNPNTPRYKSLVADGDDEEDRVWGIWWMGPRPTFLECARRG